VLTGYRSREYLGLVTPEEALLETIRLGLKGETASLARYAKRVLRHAASADWPDRVRTELAKLLADAESSQARTLRSAVPQPVSVDGSFPFLALELPTTDPEPLLPALVAREVDQLVRERQRFGELAAAGLSPTRTVLFTGPPGVGKTMTAGAVAAKLKLPLFRMDLSALMSSYLGRTGQNLKDALTRARSAPSVTLLDEFDAIAKRRDDPGDVGELKRIVNVLLMELEVWPETSLLVAATNHPELLDRAIWRRFEKVITFTVPDAAQRRLLLLRTLSSLGRQIDSETLQVCTIATEGDSGSDLATLARAAVRRAVLADDVRLEDSLLESALDRLLSRALGDSGARSAYCRLAHEHLGVPQREIARRLGVSHVTVGKILKAPARAPKPASGETQNTFLREGESQ
jgi:SpoVK/Ycf46/Vps4 family AAA+-type ATPase